MIDVNKARTSIASVAKEMLIKFLHADHFLKQFQKQFEHFSSHVIVVDKLLNLIFMNVYQGQTEFEVLLKDIYNRDSDSSMSK